MNTPPRLSFLVPIAVLGLAGAGSPRAQEVPETLVPTVIVSTASEPIAPGKFAPTWQSLGQYQTPEWFRDAKFGIWAHWGPQCEPEDGDWYARNMYMEESPQNKYHVAHYGPPSKFGFKDVINRWKAENWDPEKLVALYQRAGAQYFFALADHHDNFDLWDSKYQPWNSVRVGPHKDLIAGWAKAARDHGLRFGVSVHASHAWTWYEPAQGADKAGPFAGVPYDGRLTKADGIGTWWEGLDPQDLYAQDHPLSLPNNNPWPMSPRWTWGNGASQPDKAYCDKYYNRVVDLINRYQPDLVYFDDNALPLWPVSDAGLKIAAHFYNQNMRQHGGKLEAVLFGKVLDEAQRRTMVWDIERGQSDRIEPLPWQTDTCLGDWHYQRSLFLEHRYKTARNVVQTLVDVVSKNGNLLLNVPVRGDGTIDDDELKVVEGIAAWMDVNRECIFATRPWSLCGEGPALENAAPTGQGFNEGKGKPFTGEDVRFTTKGGLLYAVLMAPPPGGIATIKSLAVGSTQLGGRTIQEVAVLGQAGPTEWTRDVLGLHVKVAASPLGDFPVALRIGGAL